jgi:hypothetical protein
MGDLNQNLKKTGILPSLKKAIDDNLRFPLVKNLWPFFEHLIILNITNP